MTQIYGKRKQPRILVALFPYFLLFLTPFSCVQNENSSSNDREQYKKKTIDTSTPAGSKLSIAYRIIKNTCVGCHSYMDMTTNQEWVDSGLIVPGAATSSMLYCRIKGSDCGAEDMPKDSSISNSDLLALKDWIDHLEL